MSTSRFLIDSNVADTIAANGNPTYTGIQLHTASQALPITLHWGTRRISPQLIWQSDLTRAYPNSNSNSALQPPITSPAPTPLGTPAGPTSVGNIFTINPTNPVDPNAIEFGAVFLGSVSVDYGGGHSWTYGSNDANSSFSTWYYPTLLALAEGPIDSSTPLNAAANGINRIFGSGGQAAATFDQSITWPGSLPGPAPTPPSLFYAVFPGSTTQTAWSLFSYTTNVGIYPGQNLAYRGIAYIATPFHWRGHSGSLPQQDFEVCKTVAGYSLGDSYGIGVDMSPAYILQDLLTNVQYGLGLLSTDIDATSLATYRNYCGAQGLFFSPLLTGQTAGTAIVDRLAMESNSWLFWSGTAFMCVPLGDEALSANGYTHAPDTTAAYNLSNNDFIGPLQVDRADPIDCNNVITLEFADRSNNYATNVVQYKDTTLINQFGLRDAGSISADDICDVAVAAIAADLLGKRTAYIRLTYSFTLSYRFVRILPGTILTVSDPNLGLSLVPVRVQSVEEADDFTLRIVAEEYPGTLGIARPQAQQPWLATGQAGTSGGTTTGVGGSGAPVSTSGGGATLTSGTPSIVILFVAGDLIVLPASLVPGVILNFKHDTQRVIPLVPLEGNPATIQRPTGATYTIEDAQDGSLAAGASVTLRESGGTYPYVFDGGTPGVFRSLG